MLKRGRMDIWYWLGWRFFRMMFATYFRWRVLNAERVPIAGPIILAANHASYIDPPLVGAGLSRIVTMLAHKSLFRFPGFGHLLRLWHAVPVDINGASPAGLKAIIKTLQAGNAVLIFPEGTRSFNGQLLPPRPGLGLVVIKSAAPLIPVRLWGTYEAYSRSARFPRPKPIVVKYGRPLMFQELRKEAMGCSKTRLREIYQDVANHAMAEIAAMKPFPDADPAPLKTPTRRTVG